MRGGSIEGQAVTSLYNGDDFADFQEALSQKPDLSGLVSPSPFDRFSSCRSLIPTIPARELGTHEAEL